MSDKITENIMNEQMVVEYYKNWEKLQRREWTTETWSNYCVSVLEQLMEENKEVFVRLKNR